MSVYGIYAVANSRLAREPLRVVQKHSSSHQIARPVGRSDSFDPHVASACGVVLREWRHRIGLAQDAFALLADLDRSYYGKLERGERQPSLTVLLRCAGAFKQPASALVGAIERQLKRQQRST